MGPLLGRIRQRPARVIPDEPSREHEWRGLPASCPSGVALAHRHSPLLLADDGLRGSWQIIDPLQMLHGVSAIGGDDLRDHDDPERDGTEQARGGDGMRGPDAGCERPVGRLPSGVRPMQTMYTPNTRPLSSLGT